MPATDGSAVVHLVSAAHGIVAVFLAKVETAEMCREFRPDKMVALTERMVLQAAKVPRLSDVVNFNSWYVRMRD